MVNGAYCYSHVPSFGATKQSNPVLEKETKVDTKTSDENKEEKGKSNVAAVALTALAAIGLAAIAIKKGKGKDVVNTLKGTADDVAKAAKKEFQDGGNYAKIRKEATKNLKKADKTIVKDVLSAAHADKLQAEQIVRSNMLKNTSAIKTASTATKSIQQGMKHATKEGVEAKITIAKSYADEAAEALSKQVEIVANAPTHKNKKLVACLTNKSNMAQKNALHVSETGAARIQEIEKKAAEKAANIAKMQASPNFVAGQEKMAQNAAKTTANAVSKKAAQTMSKPAYQRALKKFTGYAPEKLQGVIASTKSTPMEKTVAKDLLAQLAG